MTALADLESAVTALGDLIAFPSVSSDSNLDLIVWAQARLDALGARTQMTLDRDGRKANLFATIGPNVDGGVVLSGHTDVVPVTDQIWASDPFAMREADGRLYGRGACDMKGFIACALTLAPRFAAATLTRPLHLALTYDEETGCLGAPVLLEALARTGPRPGVCIVGEPTEMRVIDAHKAVHEYTTRFTGLEGHGSQPELGVNAVEYAARFVGELLDIKDALRARAPAGSPFDPPWSTLNVGRIEGGVAHNVIAGRALVDWEYRPVSAADAAFVKARIEAHLRGDLLPAMRAVHPGATAETETIGEVVGLEPLGSAEAAALADALTGGTGRGAVSFGTEAGLFQAQGISTVVCGPGSIAQAHKPDEYVTRDQMAQCLAMIGRLLPKLSA
ncbi:MAG: acetylornithine deacetylase [Paracoccaceae bacterium]|jgi:acetylornithine deacetylase